MKLKRYNQYLKEATQDDVEEIKEEPQASKYEEVLEEVKSMINKTIENSGGEYKTFIETFIKATEDIKIEGLINESDIYDFYLKYRNQIDEVLNDIKFYTIPPSEENVFGLYDYMIKGTNEAIMEFVKML